MVSRTYIPHFSSVQPAGCVVPAQAKAIETLIILSSEALRGDMMARSPIMALIMSIIPLVNLYLIYKWIVEYKAATKAGYNPIVQLILWLIPIVNLYFIWKFLTGVEEAAKAKGSTGYPLGATVLYIVSIILGLPALYLIYRTQELLNTIE